MEQNFRSKVRPLTEEMLPQNLPANRRRHTMAVVISFFEYFSRRPVISLYILCFINIFFNFVHVHNVFCAVPYGVLHVSMRRVIYLSSVSIYLSLFMTIFLLSLHDGFGFSVRAWSKAADNLQG